MNSRIVLQAALELVDVEGLEALSMRRLGHKLDRDPMALYRYAANRDALLDGLTELLLDQWVISEAEDTDAAWQDQLRRAAHRFRSLVLEHPHVVPLLVTRPLSTPLGLRPLGALRPLEQLLAVFTRAGFGPSGALHAYRAYYGFLLGHVINELEEFVVNPDEDDTGLRLGLHRLPEQDFPYLRRLGSQLLDYDGEVELDQGITIVLSGLQSQLESPAHAPDKTSGF
ncbi:TetR/AcrR family transcriptional regulator C-terminal domain-containing protein [Arthrobacter zhaoguopingii]|uniref:TetR/AcrR family transcriptional regulator C-terminal domain-containing protein n=1 Tax=Arthrobacter zhaoguopingii TaxID=2681491 RepID=UPI001FE6E25E|nr:TetR/AcrR family transcriptional regulator C-terminal domain-containing protein [Arthrobacter zhaoguopingii]